MKPLSCSVPTDASPDALNAVVDAYGNCEANLVDDEKNTPCDHIDVVVAAVEVPKFVAVVNGYEKIVPEVR